MKSTNTKYGFTIVETLVAITILMIAIAGPLSIASKGLTAAITSRDQMIASYLAQESIEVIKNIRDNNIAASASWINGFSGCTFANPCDASSIDSLTIATGASTYSLKITSNTTYSHSCSSTCLTTPFSRYFYVSKPGTTNNCQNTDQECTLTVSVSWTEGTVPYQVLSSSELLNSPR